MKKPQLFGSLNCSFPLCFTSVAGSLFIALAMAGSGLGADISDQEVLKRLAGDQPRDTAVRKGLEYLRKQQKPDGSASERYPVALTAMAVMAHFAAGHPPADKQYGPWLKKSINYVLSKQNTDGYFGESDGS